MNWWQELGRVIPSKLNAGFGELSIYGIIMAGAIGLAMWVNSRIAKWNGLDEKVLDWVTTWAIIGGIIGARVYHVVDYWGYYSIHLIEIAAIWNGGIGIYGALLGGLLGLFVGTKLKAISLIKVLNITTPGLLLAQGFGRWGNWFNQEGFGGPTNAPWGIWISPTRRPEVWAGYDLFHPVFLYESILCLIGFGLLWWMAKSHKWKDKVFGSYCVMYGLIRLFTESFRLDTAQVDGLKVATLLSVVMIGIGIFSFLRYKPLQSIN